MRYNPGLDLATRYPHYSVERAAIAPALAATIPGRCLILIDDQLDRDGWDSCLTHEIVHLDRRDRCTGMAAWLDRKLESAVDKEAARRLISLDALAAALLWDRHPRQLAAELGVDVPTVTVRLHCLTDDERDHLEQRADEAQDWGAT